MKGDCCVEDVLIEMFTLLSERGHLSDRENLEDPWRGTLLQAFPDISLDVSQFLDDVLKIRLAILRWESPKEAKILTEDQQNLPIHEALSCGDILIYDPNYTFEAHSGSEIQSTEKSNIRPPINMNKFLHQIKYICALHIYPFSDFDRNTFTAYFKLVRKENEKKKLETSKEAALKRVKTEADESCVESDSEIVRAAVSPRIFTFHRRWRLWCR